MVPSNVAGVVVLLLLVIPGIWYELLRQRYRPGRDDSTFIEISRVLMAGVIISGLTVAVLALCRLLGPDIVADVRALVSTPTYFRDHIILIGVTLAYFLTISLTIAPIWLHLTATKGLQSGVRPESAWVTAFSRIPAEQAQKQGFDWQGHLSLEVHFTDESPPLRGTMVGYSTPLDPGDRELTLGMPIERYDQAAKSWKPVDSEGDRVSLAIVPGSQISQVLTKYFRTAAPVAERRSSWTIATGPITNLLAKLDKPTVVAKLLGTELLLLVVATGVNRVFLL